MTGFTGVIYTIFNVTQCDKKCNFFIFSAPGAKQHEHDITTREFRIKCLFLHPIISLYIMADQTQTLRKIHNDHGAYYFGKSNFFTKKLKKPQMRNRLVELLIRNRRVKYLSSDRSFCMSSIYSVNFNFKLTAPPHVTFVNILTLQVLIAGIKSAIFCACTLALPRCRLLLLHWRIFQCLLIR